MIKEEDVYKIGHLGKPHGVNGEMFFYFDDDIFDRVDCDYLIVAVDGILVPFYLDQYRFRKGYVALVKFTDVDTVERATEMTNAEVFFPRELAEAEDEVPTLQFLIGFDIIDAATRQPVGTITGVNDSTANILFELDNGHLIPASDDLILNIDTEREEIVVDIPEGLLEL
jgi:16S rRNA processing protein RimM